MKGDPRTIIPWQSSTVSFSFLEEIRSSINNRVCHSLHEQYSEKAVLFCSFTELLPDLAHAESCKHQVKQNKKHEPPPQRWACKSATVPFCLWALLLNFISPELWIHSILNTLFALQQKWIYPYATEIDLYSGNGFTLIPFYFGAESLIPFPAFKIQYT